jgi:hypothetical protein
MRKLWAVPEFAVVAVCWVFGDGHSLGIGDSLAQWSKLTLVLAGWVVLIDAIRVLRGNRSYMPMLLKALGALIAFAICGALCYAAYTFIPLKGFVVLGILAILGALFYIAREMRMIRQSGER